jgi:hypothetical protein
VKQDEAMEFLNGMFVAFPGVYQWLRTASPNVEATKTVWAKTLEQITPEEGFSVLSRWSSGSLPVPAGYEKENFPLHVVSVVREDRTLKRKFETRDDFQRTHRRGESIFKSEPILGPFMKDVMRVYGQYCAGTITENERDRRIMELEKNAISKVGQKRKEATCA